MPNSKKPILKPVIVAGLGGTGNQVVRRLKTLFTTHYRETPLLTNFLVIDTDQATFQDANWPQWESLGDLEKVPLYDNRVPFSDVTANPGAYPEIHKWLVPGLSLNSLDAQRGAEQVRMRGRVAFYKSFEFFARRVQHYLNECEKIRNKLEALEAYEYDVNTDPIVYVISSVCGGQGAGMVLDVAAAFRVLATRFTGLNIVGILTLPSVYADKIPAANWSLVCANTHAAIKELDYAMHTVPSTRMQFHLPSPVNQVVTLSAPIFNVCYLVDINYPGGMLNSDEEVFDQIATQLFLELGTPFGAREDSIRVNLNTVAGIERDKAFGLGRRYSGFGNHTITFNREKIVELASLQSTYEVVHDSLLGNPLSTQQIAKDVDEFVLRHRVNEVDTDDLVNFLLPPSEVLQEKVAQAWANNRPDHASFARELWAMLDAFWTRRSGEVRAQAETRARQKVDGTAASTGMLSDIEAVVNTSLRQKGTGATLSLLSGLVARLSAFQQLMQSEQVSNSEAAQRAYTQAETARNEVAAIAQQMEELRHKQGRVSFFSKMWELIGYAVTYAVSLGMHRRPDLPPDEQGREISGLEYRAQDQRLSLLARCNEAMERRLAAEARTVAGGVYSECITRLSSLQSRIQPLDVLFKKASDDLRSELETARANLKRERFIGRNTMRRDVTADYVDQYHRLHAQKAAEDVMKWLLPPSQPVIDALVSHSDTAEIRTRFRDLYAADILVGSTRESLTAMIDSIHSRAGGGSLTDRIQEALQFCQPFWNIRMSGNQNLTEVLLVGLEKEDAAVDQFLQKYRAAQRLPVYPDVIPTGQDSTILISRVAHGASYYWHAEKDTYFRQYYETLQHGSYPVHSDSEWRRLPEPVPDLSREQRRSFALGIAFELIAVRGVAYFLDVDRQCTLVGTSRQSSPDWKTIPLLYARGPEGPDAPKVPPPSSMLDDDNRTEAMQRFIGTDQAVRAVREKLNEAQVREGRTAVRAQVERYFNEVLQPAVNALPPQDSKRHQLEVELQALEEVLSDLALATGALAAGG